MTWIHHYLIPIDLTNYHQTLQNKLVVFHLPYPSSQKLKKKRKKISKNGFLRTCIKRVNISKPEISFDFVIANIVNSLHSNFLLVRIAFLKLPTLSSVDIVTDTFNLHYGDKT